MSKTRVHTSQQLRQQHISQQQIRLLSLLQLSGAELEGRIEHELSENPAIEEEESLDKRDTEETSQYFYKGNVAGLSRGEADDTTYEQRLPDTPSLQEQLHSQLGFLGLSSREQLIGEQLIGSLDETGYLRRELAAIALDLRKMGLEAEVTEIQAVLKKVHTLEPAGIGARDLRECLLLQLNQQADQKNAATARRVLEERYEDFTKKHFSKIAKRLRLSEEEMQAALELIRHLNPKPGEAATSNQAATNTQLPDFLLQGGGEQLDVQLQQQPWQHLRINRRYLQLQEQLQPKKDPRSQETRSFIQKHIDNAKGFMQALRQREQTLLGTARVIVARQVRFLRSGDPMQLQPLRLKDVAAKVGVDVSTISRIVNNKRIQTSFGVFALRYFFTQRVNTTENESVSSLALKTLLKQLIDSEDKQRPLSDAALQQQLRARGYLIARRTVTKYREQLRVPVARLRRAW